MDYSSVQGSRASSYSPPQEHHLYPHPEARVYPPPPPNPQDPQGYQRYMGEENPPPHSYYGWSGQPAPAPALAEYGGNPHYQYGYQEDADCITFLRGWSFCWAVLLLLVGAVLPLMNKNSEMKQAAGQLNTWLGAS
ncbi:hypothetical protein ACP70R_011721 [Stipagrostis hirtigluma subsp. patula]